MNKWLWIPLLLGALFWNPAEPRDVGSLIPVELVQLSRDREGVAVRTDTGNRGWGENLEAAMADLKQKASGEIFLETAEYVLLTGEKETFIPELKHYFRPGTQVYEAQYLEDLEEAAAYLGQHRRESPLFRLQNRDLPRLIWHRGGLCFADGQTDREP